MEGWLEFAYPNVDMAAKRRKKHKDKIQCL